MVRKVSPNYISQTLSSPNMVEVTNVTLLPGRELFFWTCQFQKIWKLELFLQSVFRATKMYTLSLKKVASWWFYTEPANGFYCTDDNTDGECSIDNDIAADVTVPNDGTWQKGGHSSLYSRNWLLCPFRIM